MRNAYPNNVTIDPSGFVLLSDYVPHIIQEIRYFSNAENSARLLKNKIQMI